jgi:restriction system protein
MLLPMLAAVAESGRRRVSAVPSAPPECPVITLKAGIVVLGDGTAEGILIEAVAVPWFKILEMIKNDPAAAYALDWRSWEEIIAGAYAADGFDEVVLTPRSGDLGRDVIATKKGIGSIRILDQVKAHKPGHLVNATDVRAMLGVITADRNCSKGVVTTTSDFAPMVREDALLKPYMPHRLELKSRAELFPWLDGIRQRASGK